MYPAPSDTITIPLVDLYDFLTRKERPMPEPTQTTTTRKTKRGYRRLSVLLKSSDYNMIAGMAEDENRTAEQQAAHMLHKMLIELQADVIRTAYRQAEDRRLNGPAPDPMDDLPGELEDDDEVTVAEVGER